MLKLIYLFFICFFYAKAFKDKEICNYVLLLKKFRFGVMRTNFFFSFWFIFCPLDSLIFADLDPGCQHVAMHLFNDKTNQNSSICRKINENSNSRICGKILKTYEGRRLHEKTQHLPKKGNLDIAFLKFLSSAILYNQLLLKTHSQISCI